MPAHPPDGVENEAGVIEQIMFFALGALLATLVALLVLPAVWHRAVRLTTRRVEAAVPVSLFEIQADKDQQRAVFALNQRRLELQADKLRDTLTAQATTNEHERQRIRELEDRLAAVDQERHTLADSNTDLARRLGEVEASLAERSAALDATSATLAEREAVLTDLTGRHEALLVTSEEQAATLSARQITLTAAETRISTLESEVSRLTTELAQTTERLSGALAETTARLTGVTAELEATRAAAGAERSAAASAAENLTRDLDETQAALAGKVAESDRRAERIADLEAELATLKTAFDTASTDLEANRAILAALEQRRAADFAQAEDEKRAIAQERDRLKADHGLMALALERARADLLSENSRATLKAAISDVAARLVARAAAAEGEASPVMTLLETAAPSAEDAPNLAARIRTAAAGRDESMPAQSPAIEAAPAGAPPTKGAAKPASGRTGGSKSANAKATTATAAKADPAATDTETPAAAV